MRQAVNYLRPSFLYPAASAYQLANGVIQRFNHGRFMIYLASDGADITTNPRAQPGLEYCKSTVEEEGRLALSCD